MESNFLFPTVKACSPVNQFFNYHQKNGNVLISSKMQILLFAPSYLIFIGLHVENVTGIMMKI